MKHLLVFALFTVALASMALADDVAITVYNQNLALVKEGRTLDFQKGVNKMNLTDVAASIDPTSVHFKLKSGGDNIQLLEQNYQYDLVSSEKILQKYLGNDIDVIMKNGDVLTGRYLSSSSGYLVLQLPDGAIRLINDKEMLSVTAPKLPEGLIIVPTLQWLLSSDVSGKRDIEVSYLTSNINWHAEYVALLDATDTKLQLSGWVSLDNQSGKTYRDAKLKLVAGDINRVQPPQQMMYAKGGRGMELSAMDQGFEEKAFFEYHMYTLGRKSTIANNETKQVSLFEPATTPIKKLYRYTVADGSKDVNVVVSFKNSEANGMGMPLPAGKIRLTKLDTDGSEEFLGEDQIDHTPKDEEVEIKVGNAFDVVGETATIDSKRISDRVSELTIEVKLRNHKKEDVTVSALYNAWGNWQVIESNFTYVKKSIRQIEFTVPVAKDGESVLRFRVRLNS
jgi:hypothetical protein